MRRKITIIVDIIMFAILIAQMLYVFTGNINADVREGISIYCEDIEKSEDMLREYFAENPE